MSAAEVLEAQFQRERLRTVLKYRADAAAYFDTARSLGPQVFLDTIPSAINSLVIILLGNIAVEDPVVKSRDGVLVCATNAPVAPYVSGLIAASYAFLGLLAFFLMRKQVTTHIRWPFLLVMAWMGFICAWTIIGLSAIFAGRVDCYNKAPFLFGFAALEVGLSPLFAGAWLLRYGAAIIAWCWTTAVQTLVEKMCGRKRQTVSVERQATPERAAQR